MSKARPWLGFELEFLRRQYDQLPNHVIAKTLDRTVESVNGKARLLGLKKPPELVAELARQAMLMPSHPARRHRFAKGIRPWNTGVKGVTGTQETCKATQFKQGQRPANYQPIGSYRVNGDGYVERKMTDDPALATSRRWTPVHRLVWEAEHGPIPPTHNVVFKPGMRTTDPALVTLDRLECIDRAEHMRRHTFHQYGPEVASVVHLRSLITRQINKRVRNEQDPQ